MLVQIGQRAGVSPQELDPGLAWAAGIDQGGAGCGVEGAGRGLENQCEADGARAWIAVVERHLQRAALESTAARDPGDLAGRRRGSRAMRRNRCVACASGNDEKRDEHKDLCDVTRHLFESSRATLGSAK